MGDFGAGKSSITLYTTKEKVAYVTARADRLGWSNSKVLDAIVDQWLAAGAPSVSALDVLPPPVPADLVSEKARLQLEARAVLAHAAKAASRAAEKALQPDAKRRRSVKD